ncbi:MAG: F0F1 ATP synthase subunit epsilon [Deltaproteobacteria bacterium]|jgi:F-type H+-transporting ATPase subunit epsilon|nr:F0F1 ATP synthase subunit epsilon [Deltaproteobacteria bacterium]
MENALQLEVVTPDKQVVSQAVDYVSAPGVEGEFGVLPHHVNLLSALAIGVLRFNADGKNRHVFISGGFADVSANKVTVLAEAAELAEDIDQTRAQAARERAENRLAEKAEKVDLTRAEASLRRAVTRLQLAAHR